MPRTRDARSPDPPTDPRRVSSDIGTLNEKPLHAALKEWYARPGDRMEATVEGFVVDLVRDGLLIEIQTGNFTPLRRKLERLARDHCIRVVYPIAREKWIVKLPQKKGDSVTRRKSPKRGTIWGLFEDLVNCPRLLADPRLSLEVVFTQQEEVRRHAAGRSWRRKGWVTVERRLLAIVEQRRFQSPADLAALLPADLPEPFSTADLAREAGVPRRLAQRAAYCLRQMNAIALAGKDGNALLYEKPKVAGAAPSLSKT